MTRPVIFKIRQKNQKSHLVYLFRSRRLYNLIKATSLKAIIMSSSVNQSHSGDDRSNDAAFTSHQDEPSKTKNKCVDDDNNTLSSQDDSKQRVNKIRKQLHSSISKPSWTEHDEQENEDEFLALQDKDLVSNNNFRSFYLSDDTPDIRKVSLSPRSSKSVASLSSLSSSGRQPLQPTTKHNVNS